MKGEGARGFGWGRLIFWATTAIGVLAVLASVAIIILGVIAIAQPFKQECVGHMKVSGELVTGSAAGGIFSAGTTGSDEYVQMIEDAGERGDVKALVIEVDSPGGSVVASREIHDAVRDLSKPKVAYFREVAASGGYYVAAPADYIISDPDAITGSIGARATFTDLSGLFGKIGYNQTVIKSGSHKDMGDPYRPMSEEEINITQAIVDEMFNEFVQAVEDGRGTRLDREGFQEILDARILTGRQAKSIGLVDEIGNRKAAFRKAAALANMSYDGDTPPICEIGGKKGLLDEMLSSASYAAAGIIRLAVFGPQPSEGVRLEYY